MQMRITVTFRGSLTDVIVTSYEYDPETNGLDVEWRFDGLTPSEHDDLRLTGIEEDAIIDQISEAAQTWHED